MRFFEDDVNRTPGNVHYVNEQGVPEEVADVWLTNGKALNGRPIVDEIAAAIDSWSRNLSGPSIAAGSLFFRNRYTMTSNVYDQMLQCSDAVEYDEILASTCDATENLAFSNVSVECVDADQEDVWNQVAEDLDFDTLLRVMWRELFKVSQFYVAVDWQQKTYKVRTRPTTSLDPIDSESMISFPGAPPGTADPASPPVPGAEDLHPSGVPNPGPKRRQRRKQFTLMVPAALSVLDPTKVLPVGQLLFGQERFAYIADMREHQAFVAAFEGKRNDPTVLKMFEGPYTPTLQEREYLTDGHRSLHRTHNSNSYLWLFKKNAVFRHTLSRAHYERFSSVRLKSVLPVLDIKAHLRASDRAALIGATNFIVVIKRGSDKYPAKAAEIEQLREQARVVARMPILVGDHRLTVEIVTPKTDFVLDSKRYNVLDERLIMRGLSTFRLGGGEAGRSDNPVVTDEVVARGIESRRAELARTLEEKIFRETLARNEDSLTEMPRFSFHPKRVVIQFNADIINAVLQLRDRGEISRSTMLEELDYDQEIEFIRRKREKALDPTFQSSVPFSSPATNPHALPGQGGRPPGTVGVGQPPAPPGHPGGPTPPAPAG